MEMDLIYERAHSFHRTTGIELDSLISQATEAYLLAEKTFKQNKGTKLTTHAYKIITNNLIDFCKNENKIKKVSIDKEDFPDTTQLENLLSYELRVIPNLNKFSKNIRILIETIFKHAEEFDLSKPRECRSKILTILEFELGWGQPRRKNTIRQLKQILKNTPENELF